MKRIWSITLVFFSTNTFALFCPNNLNVINVGDTPAHVRELCGKPDKERNYKKTTVISEEWSFFVKPQFENNATSKMTIVFQDNSVVNITVDDSNKSSEELCAAASSLDDNSQFAKVVCDHSQERQSVSATLLCGPIIKIGDTMETVEATCGKPVSIHQNKQPDSSYADDQMTEFKYLGKRPVTLLFENGILTENS